MDAPQRPPLNLLPKLLLFKDGWHKTPLFVEVVSQKPTSFVVAAVVVENV